MGNRLSPSAQEVSNAQSLDTGVWTVVERNLEETRGPLKYSDTRFWLAYPAVLAAATIVIRAHGARVRRRAAARGGRWQPCASSQSLACPTARYYDDCRRKPNVAEYDIAGGVSDAEAAELLREAERLVNVVRDGADAVRLNRMPQETFDRAALGFCFDNRPGRRVRVPGLGRCAHGRTDIARSQKLRKGSFSGGHLKSTRS